MIAYNENLLFQCSPRQPQYTIYTSTRMTFPERTCCTSIDHGTYSVILPSSRNDNTIYFMLPSDLKYESICLGVSTNKKLSLGKSLITQ